MTVFARVVFPLPLDQSFLYAVPEAFRSAAKPGARVVAPLGPKRQSGFIVGLTTEPPAPGLQVKELLQVLDDRPFHDARFLEFTETLAAEFHSSWGELLQASVPPALALRIKEAVVLTELGRTGLEKKGLGPRELALAGLLDASAKGRSPLYLKGKMGGRDVSGLVGRMAKKGLVEVRRTEVRSTGRAKAGGAEASVQLGLVFPGPPGEAAALAPVERDIAAGRFGAWYVFGSAASRRSALRTLIIAALAEGGRVLYLFPEAAPAGQFGERFKKDYGRTAVVFHGRMTEAQKNEAWRLLVAGRASLVAGTRSALFLEAAGLRLIVVDEEQEESYFQAEGPSYDARRGSWLRARAEGVPVVFSSSRPSVEAFYEAERQGRLISLETESRRARVSFVDYRREFSLVSRELETRLRARLKTGERAILFLNRRGYASELVCSACGRAPRCPRCDISLVFHKAANRLVCHYCDYSVDRRRACSGCGGEVLAVRGAGTEALEEELGRLFPGVRMGRFDADTASAAGAQRAILAAFGRGKIPILIGTQLLVHQENVPRVPLVGILRPEALLGLSDYRAGQKAYEAVSAMADFAEDDPGAEVVIQTPAPAPLPLEAAAAGDYRLFYAKELEFRRVLNYPPFTALAEVLLQGRDVRALAAKSRELRTLLLKHAPGLEVLGPALASVARVRDVSRVQVVLKAAERETIGRALRETLPKIRLKRSVVFSYAPFR